MEVQHVSVRDFFSKNFFSLPRYQRSYDWKKDEQLKDLFNDLDACMNVVDKQFQDLYLGTVLLDKVDTSNSTLDEMGGVFEIIDGQQRITTLSIIFVALRNVFQYVANDKKSAEKVQTYIGNFPAPHLIETSAKVVLSPAKNIGLVYEYMAHPAWRPPFTNTIEDGAQTIRVQKQVNRMKPVYEECYNYIKEIWEASGSLGLANFESQLFDTTFLIRITLADQSQASDIFERTNDRGKALSIADLLKNYLHSRSKEMPSRDVERDWSVIVENSSGAMKQLLKYFIVSRRGSVSNREVYRELKDYSLEVGPDEFVNDLTKFSEFFSAYKGDYKRFSSWLRQASGDLATSDEHLIAESHVALQRFGIIQPTPLIYSVAIAFRDFPTNHNSHFFAQFMRMLESYHYINNKICNRIGNDVEKTYQKTSEVIWNDRSKLASHLEDLRSVLEQKVASHSEFSASLETMPSRKVSSSIKRYTLGRLCETSKKDNVNIDLFDQKIKVGSSKVSLMSLRPAEKKYEFLGDILPFEILAPSEWVNNVQSNNVDDRYDFLRKRIDHERLDNGGVVSAQFRNQLDFLPRDPDSGIDRLKKLTARVYEDCVGDITQIKFVE